MLWPLSTLWFFAEWRERCEQRCAERIALKALKAEARHVHQFWENMRRAVRREV